MDALVGRQLLQQVLPVRVRQRVRGPLARVQRLQLLQCGEVPLAGLQAPGVGAAGLAGWILGARNMQWSAHRHTVLPEFEQPAHQARAGAVRWHMRGCRGRACCSSHGCFPC